MKILVVGATGSVGRMVVAEPIRAGHAVRALVRDPAKYPIASERGGRWDSWNYAKAQKKDGGRVYIVVASNGEVAAHEGYLTHDELRRAKAKKEKAKKGEAGKPDAEKPKSAITAAMRNYLDLHRHAAVRLAMISRPSDALRLLIAHAVAASGNWSVKPDSCRPDSTAIALSVQSSAASELFAAEALAVYKLLASAFVGEREDGELTVAGQAHDDTLTARVFARLLKLKDA